ncbi:hypothetical protein ACP70R_049624 [Stipagrostis hirtigluma subsp. patula]
MWDFSSAVQWWEEWQLRILVLGSLFLQFILFAGSMIRNVRLPSLFRSCMWLAYLGSDALAIYALSTLFNRHSRLQASPGDGSNTVQLEVLWAPVLLLHLGGQHTFTAYGIEDNELWGRHLVTLVSQVTVALYVFCKSWSGGDKKLVQAATLLFIIGILKFIQKPLALRAASFNSLMTSSAVYPQRRTKTIVHSRSIIKRMMHLLIFPCLTFESMEDAVSLREEEEHDLSLEQYVQKARDLALQPEVSPSAGSSGEPNTDQPMENSLSSSSFIFMGMEERERGLEEEKGEISSPNVFSLDSPLPGPMGGGSGFDPGKLFVDLSNPYHRRLKDLASFLWHDLKGVYDELRANLTFSFQMIYTNFKTMFSGPGYLLKLLLPFMSLASAILFDQSHKDGCNGNDVRVTYILLWCTTLLGFLPLVVCCFTCFWGNWVWSITAAQHNLLSFSARGSKPTKLMKFFAIMGCMDYINKHWYIQQASTPACLEVINLVFEHLKDGWKQYIVDGVSYRRFNNLRGQWAMSRHKVCDPRLLWSLKAPFDQSVLVWHVATELCLHHSRTSPTASTLQQSVGRRCSKVISNYMIYMLLIRPEMLMPGTRQGLFTITSDDIEVMLNHAGRPSSLDEISAARRILDAAQSPSLDASRMGPWILKACKLAEDLMELLGEEERWKVIQGVWVEMLCYSAGRCRGYLHAKSMGEGTEFLTFIWLLLSQMGMETFADKFQRPEPVQEEEIDPRNLASQSEDIPVEEIAIVVD